MIQTSLKIQNVLRNYSSLLDKALGKKPEQPVESAPVLPALSDRLTLTDAALEKSRKEAPSKPVADQTAGPVPYIISTKPSLRDDLFA